MSEPDLSLTLYSRDDCHLCDQAEAVVAQVIAGSKWQLQKINIDTDSQLQDKYGWLIPVLARPDTGTELNWPFPPSRIKALLK